MDKERLHIDSKSWTGDLPPPDRVSEERTGRPYPLVGAAAAPGVLAIGAISIIDAVVTGETGRYTLAADPGPFSAILILWGLLAALGAWFTVRMVRNWLS